MSSPRSTASFQSLVIAQALSASTSSIISDGSVISLTHDRGIRPKRSCPQSPSASASAGLSCADTSPAVTSADGSSSAAVLNEPQSGSIRVSQLCRPLGTVADAAASETSVAQTPPSHMGNHERSSSQPPQVSSYHDGRDGRGREQNANISPLIFPMALPTADVPVPGGHETGVSLPIALFIPARYIPELWVFPAPLSDHASNLRFGAGPEGESRYPYSVRRYMAESYAEDPYPMRSRLHFRP